MSSTIRENSITFSIRSSLRMLKRKRIRCYIIPMEGALQGLSKAEVEERQRQGLVNRPPGSEWRDYLQILSRNLLTWFNFMVTPAAVALFFLGEIPAGIAVSGMAIVNSTL